MRPFSVVLAAAALNVCVFAGAASSASLQGTWSGRGYVKPTEGQREMVSCRVSYSPQGSKVVAVSATCASSLNDDTSDRPALHGHAEPLCRGLLQQRI